MDPILYTAMAGAKQTQDQQSVINHNLANVDTAGFKAQLSAMRAVPVQGPGALDTRTSVVASTPGYDSSGGTINQTGRPLDVAIRGDGWLAVQTESGEAYTRRGDLQVDQNGVITAGGQPVMGERGPIVAPLEAELSIGEDGTVTARNMGANANELVELDRLKLVNPPAADLQRRPDGLFQVAGQQTQPASDQVRLATGALEGANMSAVEGMVDMINNSRRYELQMSVIQKASENAQQGNSLLRLQG